MKLGTTNPVRRDRPLMSAEGSGWSATKRGAWIGAGLGFVAGTYGGILLAQSTGCKLVLNDPPRPCHAKQTAVVAIAASSTFGTLGGAMVGAGIGKIVGVLTPD